MKALSTPILLLLVAASCCVGQDNEQKTGFDWLKKFEGNWQSESKSPGQDVAVAAGTFTARSIGNNWLLCEHDAKMGAMQFRAIQRIGYDSDTKRYIGSWFDSVSKFVWSYDGSLNEKGTTLTLNAAGPDFTNPEKTRDYRDIYEFKTDSEIATTSQIKKDDGSWETFMTGTMTKQKGAAKKKMANATTVTPFLLFTGKAEEAINYYKEVFPGTEVLSMSKYGPDSPGREGTVQIAEISIAGQRVKCIDSPAIHDFDFTPSFSFFVECENEEQLKQRFEKLSNGGKVMMPVNNYGFSKKFGWTSDKFGVSWQLNLK